MPVSLRLPADVETQIARYSGRLGLSKSAVIVRSIQEFLARHAQPTSQQIYDEAMRDTLGKSGHLAQDALREGAERREHKLVARDVIRRKRAQRSTRAESVKPASRSKVKKSA